MPANDDRGGRTTQPNNDLEAVCPEEIRRLLLTYRQASVAMALSERTVWNLVASGKLASVRINRSVRIPVAAIEAFIQAQTDGSNE